MSQIEQIREGNDPNWALNFPQVGVEGPLLVSSSTTHPHPSETVLERPSGGLLTWANVDSETESVLRTIFAGHAPERWAGLASAWRVWVAFCRVHGVDPDAPADQDVVAFVMARALAGVSWSTLNAGLVTLGLGLGEEFAGRLVPARRLLVDLFDDGWFAPEWQAPVLSIGEVLAMVEAAGSPRDRFLVSATYLGGVRPGEWRGVDVSDVHVTRDGRVQVRFPWAKTGRFQRVEVQSLGGVSLDLAPVLEELVGGRSSGPLFVASRGPAGRELSGARIRGILVQVAANAGVTDFSPYSLRRSMAVHANLLGVPGAVVRARLRHSGDSQMWRRYIDPLLGLLDVDVNPWLSTVRPSCGPVDVSAVSGGVPRVANFAMAAGSIEELLEGVDLPSLRVHPSLVSLARSSFESGERSRLRFLDFQREQGRLGIAVGAGDVVRWLTSLVDRSVDPILPSTGLSYLSSLEVGWLSVAKEPLPGVDLARTWLKARDVQEKRDRKVDAEPRKKSRVAEAGEGLAVVEAAWSRVPELPPVEWAVRVLGLSTGAAHTVAIVGLGEGSASVVVDGVRRVDLVEGDVGVYCPVLAATVLAASTATGGAFDVPSSGVTEDGIVEAAREYTRRLNEALVVTLLVGSGCRPSDLARARVEGIQEWPSAFVITQAKSKGKRPRAMGRRRYILAPSREGVMSPHGAWCTWASWWPTDGEGFVVLSAPDRVREPHPRPYLSVAARVGVVVSEAVALAGLPPGLSAYGFRYARAQSMHDGGLSIETIADVLGHDDIRTSLAYVTRIDPFADGVAEADARAVVETLDAICSLGEGASDDAA